ncbi:MAG: hypothetical protein J6Y93_02160 [Treponema sp.]|nr:hypothetical protein [Treponema sp.]
MLKKMLLPAALLLSLFTAGCSKEKPDTAVKVEDPLKGKMYAFTEEFFGVPSFTTIDFGMNGEVSIVNGSLLPVDSPEDAVSRISGTYKYDSANNSVFIKSTEDEAEQGYQANFIYDQLTKTISISDEYGNTMIFEEVPVNEN